MPRNDRGRKACRYFGATRQMRLPTSSATKRPPRWSNSTLTGRPRAFSSTKNPVRNADFVSATPSPSVSRSKVMRLALAVPAPARVMIRLATKLVMLNDCFPLGGLFDSATRTSPFGNW